MMKATPRHATIRIVAVAIAAAGATATSARTLYVDADNCPDAYPAGEGPLYVAVGDLDGINGPDLAVANSGLVHGDVSVLLNQGDGTFSAATAYAVGPPAKSVAIGDLDGANGPDLAVAIDYWSDPDLKVLLNQGDGTFVAAGEYAAGDRARSVAIGDLDGINGPDLAVASSRSDDVSVLLNWGDGTFAAAVAYDAGDAPYSVAIGDLDGVNGPDLAVANWGSNGVSVLLNRGDGTFAAAVAYAAGDAPCSVAIGDLDGVNGPDLAVANSGSYLHGDGAVSVLLNHGDGTFAAVEAYPGYRPGSVAIGELDGINGADLAVASGYVWVLLNRGGGTFPGSGTEANPYCSIQTAIDNASDTDEIVVAPGNYNEAIHFLGNAITLRSSDGPEVTIIDASGLGQVSVVTCWGGHGPDTLLEGFTIRGGTGTPYYPCGIMDPNSFRYGGGMFVGDSSPTILDCVFADNTVAAFCVAEDNYLGDVYLTGFGGGIYLENSNPTIMGCVFSGNGVSAGGGGIYTDYNSNPTIIGCVFQDNVVGDQGTGGEGGGGMCNWGSPTVVNCTFSGNTAAIGGGMRNKGSSNPTVTNCILWGNIPDEIHGNAVVTYSDVQGGYPDPSNIFADPLFVDPDNGDYRLAPGSPCIDAGDNTVVPDGIDTDLNGKPRFIDDPDTVDTGYGDPPIVDMGAYEFQGMPCPWDLNDNGFVWIFDLLLLLFSWGPCDDPGNCQADFDSNGYVDAWDFIDLLCHFGPCP
jgi:hypothetical protein